MLIDLANISTAERQQYLQTAIAPRPIALVSTVDREGLVNLSPFSFFNVFSADPPLVIFSPARRVRDGSRKHTLLNIEQVAEAGISIVDETMLEKVNQASADYPRGVNEFGAVGFTEQASLRIRPPLVRESKVKMECKVVEIKPMGDRGGAGNLIIARVVLMHVDDEILDEGRRIDQLKLRQVARLGGDWYCRMDPAMLFQLPKPATP